jgi:dUTP pyrophosphatase
MEKNELSSLEEKAKELQKMLDSDGDDDFDFSKVLEEFDLDLEKLDEQMKNYKPKLSLGFTKLHPDAVIPKYNYGSDSGFDLHSVEEITIQPFGRALVPTGLSFDINDGYEIQVRSKSGLAINQGLMVLNSPGTVDNGYTGEVKAIIFNTNQTSVTISKGMKVAQAVLCPVVNGDWVELEEKSTVVKKDRNNNGFGSTGI